MLTYANLHDYQQDMIDQLYQHDHRLIVADMGAGKTAATLTAISELLDDGVLNRVLVLAPLRVAASVWDAEAFAWDHTRELLVARAIGNAKQRFDALTSEAPIVVMNYENLQWLTGYYGTDDEGNKIWVPGALEAEAGRYKWPEYLGFDGLVFDEVSRMKGGHKSKRFKALKPYLKQFKWRAGLTGTPAPNGLEDLFGTAYVIDQGKALGRTLTKYREEYFLPADPNGWKWKPRFGADEEIYAALKKSAYVLDPTRYDNRTEIVVRDHLVDMSAEAVMLDAALSDDFIAEHGGEVITVANGGVLVGKQQQLAQGFIYDGPEAEASRFDYNKLEKCRELVESLDGNPVIICYQFREDLRALQSAFPDAPNLGSGVGAAAGAKVIDRWNAGELPVLLLHPQSAGHGLNLQRGGHHMIWYALTWASEAYQQAIARIHRQGQRFTVYIHRIIARGSIDERIVPVLEGKRTVEGSLIGALLDMQGAGDA